MVGTYLQPATFSLEQLGKLSDSMRLITRSVVRTDRCDRTLIEAAFTHFYANCGRDRPTFLWCRSPIEMVAATSIAWLVLANINQVDDWSAFVPDGASPWARSVCETLNAQLEARAHNRLHKMFSNFRSVTRAYSLWPQFLFNNDLADPRAQQMLQAAAAIIDRRLTPAAKRRSVVPESFVRRAFWMSLVNVGDLRVKMAAEKTTISEIARNAISGSEALARFDSEAPLVMAIQPNSLHWGMWSHPRSCSIVAIEEALGAENFSFEEGEAVRTARHALLEPFAFSLLPDLCVLCDRPEIAKVDEQNRLHCARGPSMVFSDQTKLFTWKGANVPSHAILKPENLTAGAIMNERNVASRRAMIDIFGHERFLVASGARPISSDDFGVLFSTEIQGDEPLVMVKVTNSTAEPDGTYKDYFLRVPATMRTAREAVAWTFDLNSDSYMPDVQT